ncbi:hypothetical protein YH65_09305 [Sulfurovum lithotrophicum]|uniref:Bll5565 protein n=1 Tax=Sulfurovum lithotrophicum TaxID=206403 RepID=A0A7U4M2E2_9BACT|nr:hypothetical protein [Sulfurovum lithotrophicum]AKF25550.1 hypothetical protein YH65_09305 [Sulfurovum lithotrophicum]
MLSTIKHKLITLLQLLLVITFILLEEIIWEGVAYPVYKYVHSLKILQKVEAKLHGVNRYVILVIFVIMLASVEAFGLYAGYMFVSGHILMGLVLYLSKIPIAAFTFWMFRVTEEKLMQFGWFKWIYEKIMAAIDWLKSLEIYQSTMLKLKTTKEKIRQFWRSVKIKYFSKESPFVTRIKKIYYNLKQALKK